MKNFILKKNNDKILFTPGPSSLSLENVKYLEPSFGRGDKNYDKIENYVLKKIKDLSGKNFIARMQGAGSLAIEIMINNFLYGKVLIIETGTYSQRLESICYNQKKNFKFIKSIKKIDWKKIDSINEKFDWIIACYTETSIGLKLDINKLKKLKKSCKSKLMLDATASFGLENNHKYADVMSFSSCKGLFGLTGACFICYGNNPQNEITSFNLNINNHLEKKMTGPYHSICSLYKIMKNYDDFKYSVIINKKKFLEKFSNLIVYPRINQPYLCTYTTKKIYTKNHRVVLYKSRAKINGSVICHLGEVHLKKKSTGKIINFLKY